MLHVLNLEDLLWVELMQPGSNALNKGVHKLPATLFTELFFQKHAFHCGTVVAGAAASVRGHVECYFLAFNLIFFTFL
ncbi:MAG: hypothetical protein F6K19_45025 [Cyanothece sp. SIO1E1]|nr:hypothetical protein [Cyanothece sp. SIO1E1]